MDGKDLVNLGYPPGPAIGAALKAIKRAKKSLDRESIERELRAVLADPVRNASHEHFADLARILREESERPVFQERDEPAPYKIWGEGLEAGPLDQMMNAARLPVAVSGALMPDAHQGYGLPIGGVLATENAVIPYAVGVDIACRMKLSVYDIGADQLTRLNDTLVRALHRETMFGTGAGFQKPHQHDVLDEDWSRTAVTKRVFDKARVQLGSSGSGNHFVEFGILTIAPATAAQSVPAPGGISGKDEGRRLKDEKEEIDPLSSSFNLPPGQYLALLTHSGSRGPGATVADFYSRLARDLHPELPPELRYLAWLDMSSEPGQEYWYAMNLMGKFAHANHDLIHQKIAKHIGAKVIAHVENHHNFAWKEQHGGRELIVHRKGATPAGKGVLGVIPGSMASPGFIVSGKGVEASLESASHGAGRRMSRTAAREKYRWSHIKPMLEAAGVQLLSAGIDENPHAYKDINVVMSQQADLVEVLARFDPKIVKMADAGEKPED
ncbi:MAG: RtcB family protein [Anaerolineae bacterium]|nr:RtcB family protein [Phycisphaerae bacterium]